MGRRPARFTEADVQRAIKAALKAKLSLAAVRILPDGTILITPGRPESVPSSAPNPWDDA
jgi:hypothetical protein